MSQRGLVPEHWAARGSGFLRSLALAGQPLPVLLSTWRWGLGEEGSATADSRGQNQF